MIYSVFKNGITVNSFKYSKDAIKCFYEELELARKSLNIYYLSLGYFDTDMNIVDLIFKGNTWDSPLKEKTIIKREYYDLLIDDL